MTLRQVLEHLSISDELKETKARRQMVKEQAKHLEEERYQLRDLTLVLPSNSEISPT